MLAGKILSFLLTVGLTAGLFLVLYNNSDNGMAILGSVIFLNVLLFSVPMNRTRSRHRPVQRMTSLYIICIAAAWMSLEVLFPVVLPEKYAQMIQLTKHMRRSSPLDDQSQGVVFNNEDQRMSGGKQEAEPLSGRRVSWHRPGEPFEYHGYDPNSGITYRNRFHWNSFGYFDHDYEQDKPPQVTRIIFVGDSYVESIQVPLSRTFHKLTEASLSRSLLGKPIGPIEVVALGNSGTGQAAHRKVVEREAIGFKPDLLILMLCGNDFCDDDPELKSELVLHSGEFGAFTRGLVRHGFLALAFAARQFETLQKNRIVVSPELLQWAADDIPRVERAWARTMGQVKESRSLCQREGIAFLLVYLGSEIEVKYALDPDTTINALQDMGPAHKSVTWDMMKSVRRVSDFCSSNDIVFLSLLGPLSQAQRETGNVVFADHYSMFGHEIVSRVLTCVISRYLKTGTLSKIDDCLEKRVWSSME